MRRFSRIFESHSECVIEFFSHTQLGFLIPLYQRNYSWDRDNINQLMEDVCQGVNCLLDDPEDIHFLGTIINVQSRVDDSVNAKLTAVESIIDGQQRISTLALLGTLLYRRLFEFRNQLNAMNEYEELQRVLDEWMTKKLTLLFIVETPLRGDPEIKPKVIREGSDIWTSTGSDDHYSSDVANYLARFIRAIDEKTYDFPNIRKVPGTLIRRSLRLMDQWIDKVEDAHKADIDSEYPRASRILTSLSEHHIWYDERPRLKDIVQNRPNSCPKNTVLHSIVQVLAFAHYLLHQCCFTTIKPERIEWAFDMFQSLNSTGTPLTALETFKPTVVNSVNQRHQHMGYEESAEKGYFATITNTLESGNNATKKSKLTDDLLTVFAHTFSGDQVPRRLSKQRLWLDKQYKHCDQDHERGLFVKRISLVAIFLQRLNEFNPFQQSYIEGLSGEVSERGKKASYFLFALLERSKSQNV